MGDGRGKTFWVAVFCAALTAGIFALDLLTPLGIAVFNLYVGVVLLASWLPWQRAVLGTAVGCTALNLIGALVSPSSNANLEFVAINRSIGVACTWVVALLILRRKKAEASERLAQEARTYAESIVETVREPLVILGTHLRVQRANRSYYQTFQTTLEETQQRLFFELGDGQWNVPKLRELLTTVFTQHTEFSNFEVELQVPAIGHRTMLLNGRKLYRPGNHTGQILLAIEDITERKRWEEEQERVFTSSLDLQCVAGFDGYFKRLNPAWTRTLGYTMEELLAKPWLDFVHPDDREVTMAKAQQSHTGVQIFSFENRYRHKDGSYRWLQWTANPSLERQLTYASARDVTEYRKAKEATARLAAIVGSSDDAIIGKNLDGIVTSWNKGAERLYGYRAEEILGKPITLLLPPDRMDEEAFIIARLKQGERLEHFETVRRAKDGRLIEVALTISPIRDEQGTIVGISKIARDITERKRAEEALRRAHDELEMRVQQRTVELQHKNRDLETLLYVTSHDLREPLRAIENFSRLVHDRYAERLDDKGKDFLQRVVRGAERMDRLMTDVLALSRIQRMELPSGEVEGASLVQDALRQLEGRIKETGARVQVTEDLPCLRVNKTWATQGLSNLIANALKFRRDGEAPDIEIAPYHPNGEESGEVGLIVRDRGPGVAPEHAERIFQLFQRAVGREIDGTGAGLAIVRQIAERHGGRAWVQPREGGGSEFILTFATPHATERT